MRLDYVSESSATMNVGYLATSAPPVEEKTKATRRMFSEAEDEQLKKLVHKYGTNNWIRVSINMKDRNVRQCKERWLYYLSPEYNHSDFTEDEDKLLLEKIREMGMCWTKISKFFDRRTPYAIKNRWIYLARNINMSGDNTTIEDIHQLPKPRSKGRPKEKDETYLPNTTTKKKRNRTKRVVFIKENEPSSNEQTDEANKIQFKNIEEIEPSIQMSDGDETSFFNGEDQFFDFFD